MAESATAKEQDAMTVQRPGSAEAPPPPYQPSYGAADAVPPSYEQAQSGDLPPSYDSIYGEVRRAKQESNGVLDFLKKFAIIVLGTLGCTICVSLVLAVPIAMITIGALYLHDCPRERFIPIYLIVAGTFGVVKNLSNLIQRLKARKDDNNEENAKTNPLDSTISCFLMIWFIAGNVWIYRIFNDFSTDPNDGNMYCNATLYYFSFWMTTATYILIATACCCMICAGTIAGIVDNGAEHVEADR